MFVIPGHTSIYIAAQNISSDWSFDNRGYEPTT